ncbi:hypothetical protein [Acinetobacter haemolyticus]|uniref:hypothetical protein n=1 Tax=Acinetobacter haemolyticus TaxID=29430 RepID=UPI001D198911|nr:hypothetical protein [Acinetobacter haemolyticus]
MTGMIRTGMGGRFIQYFAQLMDTFDIKNLAGENYKDISKEQLKLIDGLKRMEVEKMRKNMSGIMFEVIREGRRDTIEQ